MYVRIHISGLSRERLAYTYSTVLHIFVLPSRCGQVDPASSSMAHVARVKTASNGDLVVQFLLKGESVFLFLFSQ